MALKGPGLFGFCIWFRTIKKAAPQLDDTVVTPFDQTTVKLGRQPHLETATPAVRILQ
jgi:hypothetical protein